jgi:hypothetical protein
MLKWWKFPLLIKAHALSANCTMGNLATQHAYIQSMLNFPRFISFLLYKSLLSCNVLGSGQSGPGLPVDFSLMFRLNLLPVAKHCRQDFEVQTFMQCSRFWPVWSSGLPLDFSLMFRLNLLPVAKHCRQDFEVQTFMQCSRLWPVWSWSTSWLVRDSSADGFLFDLLEPWNVRALSIRKTADLPLQLWVGTFPRFVAIGFYFLSKTLI